MKERLEKFRKNFSENSVWSSLSRFAKAIGLKATYMVLLLFYAYKREETPSWARRVVIGALGYFVTIVDFIPDLTPFVGMTDDIGILSFGLVTIAAYINDEVRGNARQQLQKWFGDFEESTLAEVDDKL
ncbi:MAG: YkvA family protein [Bacteroidota bacterium]